MEDHAPPASDSQIVLPLTEVEARVLEVVRGLARETGGARAERAVRAHASLERDVGLGSLERVELLLRLERAFDRAIDDQCLATDTPAALARAIVDAVPGLVALPPRRESAPGMAAADIGQGVRTLQDSLWRHAQLDAGRVHVHLRPEDADEEPITYGRLLDEAAAVAGGLLEQGVQRGERVALMLPTGLDFLRSFCGVLLARAVPVPIYPPLRLDRLEEYAQRQSAILADAGARLLVTVARARPVTRLLQPSVPTLRAVVTADELAARGRPVTGAEGDGSDPALIQYTSGSTGQPKGVLLTHDNLLANVAAIAGGLALTPADVGVSWLPLYHDMGLIGSWLTCLHHGIPITLLPPTAFLARPERWLWAIHQRAATLSAAPNFAYELCARRVADAALEGLDLSTWRVALNGAEPVSSSTLERFAARLAPYGFRHQAMMPVYGLAECSVALTFPPVGRGPRVDRVAREAFQREGLALPAPEGDTGALEFVSAGFALPGHELRVVDDANRDLPERSVGRLIFRGPSMTAGYFEKPEATRAISVEGGWLDSGDLAYLVEGELHVCGRRKDLVIKGGRNIVPQEVEEAAAAVAGIRRGCVVAFGVANAATGTESLVVVAETRVDDAAARERLVAAVIEKVAEAIEVPPDEVVLVPGGSVPKTSSGKVRRSAARELYLAGELGRAGRTTLHQRLRLIAGLAVDRLQALPARAARGAYALWLTLALPPLLLGAWLLALLLPGQRTAFAVERVGARLVLRLLGCRLRATGLERLSLGGALVLASNHASYTDIPLLLALLPVDFRFVAKREVRSYPIVRTFVRRCGHLTVDRWDAQQSLNDAAQVERALRDGAQVLFFPEGTFTAATGLRPSGSAPSRPRPRRACRWCLSGCAARAP